MAEYFFWEKATLSADERKDWTQACFLVRGYAEVAGDLGASSERSADLEGVGGMHRDRKAGKRTSDVAKGVPRVGVGPIVLGGEIGKAPKDAVYWRDGSRVVKLGGDFGDWKKRMAKALKLRGFDNPRSDETLRALAVAGAVAGVVAGAVIAVGTLGAGTAVGVGVGAAVATSLSGAAADAAAANEAAWDTAVRGLGVEEATDADYSSSYVEAATDITEAATGYRAPAKPATGITTSAPTVTSGAAVVTRANPRDVAAAVRAYGVENTIVALGTGYQRMGYDTATVRALVAADLRAAGVK